jgi:NAD(P)-dependent dehydrogenase (short-subunit alcohol dehydrogenase family)
MAVNLGAGLEGKGVIVTGAAGGIGRAVTKAFAEVGARVMAVDLNQSAVDDVVAGLSGDGHVGLGVDLSDLSTHTALVNMARRELGGVRALAHLAAVLRRSSLDEVTEEDWDIQLDVNLKATFFFTRAVANAMIDQDNGGRIILFTSQGWWTGGFGGGVAYAASKGGIVTMSRSLARAYGPHGITVNSVAPGQVHTTMLMTGLSEEVYGSLKRATPLGYVAEPEELAGPAVFLASDHARYVTGATLNVSGGFLMY